MFRLKYLCQALRYSLENNVPITDEASAIENLDLQVTLVPGHEDNIKITRREDLDLASFILHKIQQ